MKDFHGPSNLTYERREPELTIEKRMQATA